MLHQMNHISLISNNTRSSSAGDSILEEQDKLDITLQNEWAGDETPEESDQHDVI